MSLRDLGLSEAQETLYRILLAEPAIAVADLAQRSGMDETVVRSELERLTDLALTFPDGTAPCGVVARRPGVALGRLAEQRTLELSRRLRDIVDTQADIIALDELASGRHGAGGSAASSVLDGVPGFEVLRGRAAISQRVDQLALDSRNSLDSITPGPPRGRDVVGTGMSIRRSVNHGMRVRWLIEPQMLDGGPNTDQMRDTLEAGAQVRACTDLVSRLIIADGTTAVVPIDITDKDAGALVITHAGLVRALEVWFEEVWRRGKPLVLDHGEPVISSVHTALDEVEVLRALASNSTDETAARAAGISDRQFRRRLNAAMTALAARNRFQAGVLAERQGLLDARDRRVKP